MIELHDRIKNKKIALYGLGTETERLINEWNGKYQIVGLLDSFKAEGEQFGYPIIPIQDVVKLDDVVIMVVARPGSCKAIAKKIGNLCKENNVQLFDVRGNNLLEEKRIVYDFKNVRGYTHAELLDKIKHVDVVSFDLFDTLIVRNVLSHSDVIQLVDTKLREKGVEIPDFCVQRMVIEKRLSQGRAPRLCEIYEKLLETYEQVSVSALELARLEFETDLSLVEIRAEVVKLINIAKRLGKKVCITTDTYYSRGELQEIFEKTKINGFDEVFASCEYGIGKTCGLFNKVIEDFETNSILHIGDDIVADIESARRHEIRSFHIYSSTELFDEVGGLGLLNQSENLSDRIKIGMFVANIFNSPFVFETENQKIQIKIAEQIGYLFCAPMILDFCFWFEEQTREHNLKNIWFGARDGYLLKKIFEQIYPSLQTEYFLTSRTAAIRSGVENEEDIAYVDRMKFSGSEDENLWKRFGLRIETLDKEAIQEQKDGILKYSSAILEYAEVRKQNYLRYMDGLRISDGNIAFFDFVAKGTTQMFLEKIVKKDITGLYFLQLEKEFMKEKFLKIFSFYEESDKTSAIFDNYYILETILTSPDSSVDEFANSGEVVYARETRSRDDISCVMNIQAGILAYIEKYMQICPTSARCINKKKDEDFLAIIHNVEILEKDFLNLKVEDPFFNRETDVVDVL